jgi:hypothetical protein
MVGNGTVGPLTRKILFGCLLQNLDGNNSFDPMKRNTVNSSLFGLNQGAAAINGDNSLRSIIVPFNYDNKLVSLRFNITLRMVVCPN